MPSASRQKYIRVHSACITLINDIIKISELDATSSDEAFESVNLYEIAKINSTDAGAECPEKWCDN